MPGHVDRDNPMTFDERWQHAPIVLPARCLTVQQHERRPVVGAYCDIDVTAVDGDTALAHERADVASNHRLGRPA